MAEYNGNTAYIKINSLEVQGKFREVTFQLSTGDENTSYGAGIEWERHKSKLSNIQATITIIWDSADAPTDASAIVPNGRGDTIALMYGPQGGTAGLPIHDQDFLVTGISGPSVVQDKGIVTMQITCISDGEPRSNIYAGDTVAA